MNAKTPPGGRHFGAGLFLGLALVAPLPAQSRLYVLGPGGKYYPVCKVSHDRPCVMEEGELVTLPGSRFALSKVEEYLPVFIAVRDKQITSTGFQPLESGATDTNLFNNTFHFSAKFVADRRLEDVFVVLDIESPNLGHHVFVSEVGRLEPRIAKPFSVDLSLDRNLGPGEFRLHLFAGGQEVFSSDQPAAEREARLDRMVARRIASVRQANPRPFFGPPPCYPAGLGGSGRKGTALVTLSINARGGVENPMVMSASEPAFGEEALAAVRQWRFLPGVAAGQAVAMKVNLPFDFEPPAGENSRDGGQAVAIRAAGAGKFD